MTLGKIYWENNLLANFEEDKGMNLLFWKLVNKAKEWSIYFAFLIYTILHDNQILEKGKSSFFIILQPMIIEQITEYHHFAIVNEIIDLGYDYHELLSTLEATRCMPLSGSTHHQLWNIPAKNWTWIQPACTCSSPNYRLYIGYRNTRMLNYLTWLQSANPETL